MRVLTVVGAFVLALGSMPALADQGGGHDDHECPDCEPRTRDVCFNLVCHYEFDDHDGHDDCDGHDKHKCTAAATFVKAVTIQGGEVVDNSDHKNYPTLSVSCDGHQFDTQPARRFTSLLGTRIQGQTGPSPAVLLPRGELHTTERDSGHYSRSVLELDGDRGFKRAKGSCFIWTGFP